MYFTGPEALLVKGTEGKTQMVRYPDGRISCYQYEHGKWKDLGEVVGASGGTQLTSGKTLHEGKEYDFVFSIDIEEGKPPLKLPYNRGQDNYVVAQDFVHQYNLPQAYLEEIANFIMKNAGPPSSSSAQPSSSYQDPFTGEGRYIPGSNSNAVSNVGNVDPFTGGSSYSTSSNQTVPVNFVGRSGQNLDPLTGNSSHTSGGTPRINHFPYTEHIILDTCDASKVLIKLK